MEVKLIGHTQLNNEVLSSLIAEVKGFVSWWNEKKVTDGQTIALSAIRTCYSPGKPSEIVKLEGQKYFGTVAKDGKEGTEADRLIRHIVNSGHTSTLEHLNFTFSIEGVSRSLLAQLTRHRHFSYSVQSQRYVKFGSEDKSEGFDYVTPHTVTNNPKEETYGETLYVYEEAMERIQMLYDKLRNLGVPAEDARYILPNAATCNLTFTGNLRSLLEFYSKRNPTTHAQWEIQELAEKLKDAVIKVEPWTEPFFNLK